VAAAAAVVVAIATHDGEPERGPTVAQGAGGSDAVAVAPAEPLAGSAASGRGASGASARDAGAVAPGAAVDAAVPVDAATSAASVEPEATAAPAPKPEGDEQRLRKRGPARPVRGPSPRTEPSRPERVEKPERAAATPGHYSVDSRPYATISIDGVVLGETPLYRVPLAPGSHQVRAVRQDGTTKTFSITITAGKEVSSGRLKW
jgi:eukaryotic-like serine/threonine-protein kinase